MHSCRDLAHRLHDGKHHRYHRADRVFGPCSPALRQKEKAVTERRSADADTLRRISRIYLSSGYGRSRSGWMMI